MISWIDPQLVEYECNLCGLRNEVVIFQRQDGLKIVQCKNCGHVYVNPRPNDNLMQGLYDRDYFMSTSSIGFDHYFSEETRKGMLIASERRLLILKKAGVKSFANMLEVGCGSGEFCHVVNNMGIRVTGIDISESAIAEARWRYKTIPFHVGKIEDVGPEEEYNAVFAFEVIEHLTNPDGFFRKASSLLNKDGFLCITTPSFECAKRVGFHNWIGFSTSFEHIHFFSAETVAKFAEKFGMSVMRTLYGGGRGLNNNENIEAKSRKVVKGILNSMRLLSFLRRVSVRYLRLKHDYQSREPRHNLFMVLRKGG
jgi:2-polyprenyl-3-methyl-5-hydroxy-6-metoxy-1,4-benzoquinol methylase/DNA-directed RNA polymerase subunit RPC12/RpoP